MISNKNSILYFFQRKNFDYVSSVIDLDLRIANEKKKSSRKSKNTDNGSNDNLKQS